MTTLFISDLHLDEERPEITRAFFQFLKDKAINAERLYILGDFFEVWIGDDAVSEFQNSVINALKDLSSSCEIFFVHGNRDFLIGEKFAESAGVTLLPESLSLTLSNTPALIMHGDSLCTEDVEYMKFRSMVRNPEWQTMFLSKSLEERLAIAAQLRDKSKQETASKEEYITDVTPSEVEKALLDNNATLLIHGHTHRPARHQIDLKSAKAERIVLGDWGESGWYLEVDENEISLKEYHPA